MIVQSDGLPEVRYYVKSRGTEWELVAVCLINGHQWIWFDYTGQSWRNPETLEQFEARAVPMMLESFRRHYDREMSTHAA